MTDRSITAIFEGAGDFIRRELLCGTCKLYAYAIDGIVAGGDAANYVFRPIATTLKGDTMEQRYHGAL